VLPALLSASTGEQFVVTLRREVVVFAVVVLLGGLLAYVPPAVKAGVDGSPSHSSAQ
jgi:hypothetical protein